MTYSRKSKTKKFVTSIDFDTPKVDSRQNILGVTIQVAHILYNQLTIIRHDDSTYVIDGANVNS